MKKKEKNILSKETDSVIVPEKQASFAIVEAYKNIRTNLMFLLSQKKNKTFVVSSALLAEGKSSVSYNCAVAFSQLGHKVLLIDADLRRPSIHKKMHLDNSRGLSSALVKFCSVEDAIQAKNSCLDIMTAGPIPPNPSELLGSEAMDQLLEELDSKYEYIIIDTPPIGIVSDALIVAPKTAGIVMVVREGYCTHDSIRKTLSSIEFAKVRLLGFVLNCSGSKSKTSYKYKYGYGYNYGYGYSSHHITTDNEKK